MLPIDAHKYEIQFPPETGLMPRTYDAFDKACHRYASAIKDSRSSAKVMRAELRLIKDFGNADLPVSELLDTAYSHGMLVRSCRLKYVGANR